MIGSISQVSLVSFCASLLTVGGTLGAAVLVSRSIQEARNVAKVNASPVIQPALLTEGSKLFALNCSHCHADDATGDEGPRSPWPDQIR
jgi:mono/diheme cytochrome c family protein